MTVVQQGILKRYDQSGRCRFNTLKGFFLQDLSEILYVKAHGNYSDLHLCGGRKRLVTHTLAVTEDLLDGLGFQRVGRSVMINLNYLAQVDRQSGECILVCQDERIVIPLTHRHIKELSLMF